MARAQVSVSFEASSAEEVEEIVKGWKLHEGCNVFWTVTETAAPMQTDAKGKAKPVPPPEPPEEE